jgi:hypothetical protein
MLGPYIRAVQTGPVQGNLSSHAVIIRLRGHVTLALRTIQPAIGYHVAPFRTI